MIRRAPSRATSSRTSARSRPEPNSASISARILSVGDTRDGTGVVLPVQTLAVLYGTYARRHLHRGMDTAKLLYSRLSWSIDVLQELRHLPNPPRRAATTRASSPSRRRRSTSGNAYLLGIGLKARS